jgi:DNA-binding response OmpR family regulator
MNSKILLVENRQADHESFGPALTKKGFQVETVPNGGAALSCLLELDPDLVIVDAASLRTSGKRICQSIRQKLEGLPIVLVVSPAQQKTDSTGADLIVELPFTAQKLVNRMKILLPPDDKDVLHIGPIRLNIKQKNLRCLGKNTRLTTRQVSLLRVLMEHPREIFERKDLFCQVWETEYTGDTRTLDVHISWLRRALEPDPRHPRLLKTIRGIGYRLDI